MIKKEPKSLKNKYSPTNVVAMDTCNHIDFVYNNYILNGLNNTLYNMLINNAKVLWKALNKKCKVEDINIKKFTVDKFLYFKMVDCRGEHFRFGSVLNWKKQSNRFFFKKKNWNRTEIESNRLVSVRFGSVLDFKKPRKPICSYFKISCKINMVFPIFFKYPNAKNPNPIF